MRAEESAPLESSAPAVGRVLVVVNRRAGGFRRDPRLPADVARIVGDRGLVVATANTDELEASVRRARLLRVDTVAICGGDGTNHATLTALSRVYGTHPWPRVALCAGGTVNTSARGLGFGGPVRKGLRALLAAREPRVLRMPLLQVAGRVGLIFGTQMPARVMDAYYDGRTGSVKCAWLALKILASGATGVGLAQQLFEPEPIELEIDGRVSSLHQATGIIASVVPAVNVAMRLAYRAGEGNGFHLLATEASPRALAREAGRAWAGLPVSVMAEDTIARHVRLKLPRGGRFMLDGDVFPGDDLELTATAPVELIGPPLP